MIEKPTTLVLGAGASSSYGMPLGSALRTNILEMLDDRSGLRRFVTLSGHSPADTKSFSSQLRYSEIDSIDDFIAGTKCKKFVEIGRTCVALSILDSERTCVKDRLIDNESNSDHWLRIVWNAMHGGASKADFENNKLSIVTFNYDRTLETYFPRVISHAYSIRPNEAEELFSRTVRVLHVHGGLPKSVNFGAFQDEPKNDWLLNLPKSIRVVHDSDMSIDAAYRSASEIVAGSSRVCFLGFAFHEISTRRLELGILPTQARPAVYACMFGMGEAECVRAEKRLGIEIHSRDTVYKSADFLRHCFAL